MKPPITEEQISAALRDLELRQQHGSDLADPHSPPTTPEARCNQLEEENRRLKLLVADLILRNEALKMVVSKKW